MAHKGCAGLSQIVTISFAADQSSCLARKKDSHPSLEQDLSLKIEERDHTTGCAIKNWTHWTHYFNLTESRDRNSSNFKATFIYYYTELSFEVRNSLFGQLA